MLPPLMEGEKCGVAERLGWRVHGDWREKVRKLWEII